MLCFYFHVCQAEVRISATKDKKSDGNTYKSTGPCGSNQFSIDVGATFSSKSSNPLLVLFQKVLLRPLPPIYTTSVGAEKPGISQTIV